MSVPLRNRLQHAWNAFRSKEDPQAYTTGAGYSSRPDRVVLRHTNSRSMVSSIYNRIAMDVASISIKHVRLNENGQYINTIDSYLNDVLTTEANIDQTGRALIKDMVMSMFDEGCIAVVPVDTTLDPTISGGYEVNSIRTAKILEWMPSHVRVRLYNDRTGMKEELTLPKNMVAIIENPLYVVMNEQSSTLQRLIRKLNLLDAIDEQSGSGKLDIIIQLPYVIKSQARREQAETRLGSIESQLKDSKYGIAYTDATEKITQLNRPTENNLMIQVTYLTNVLYSQLGLTENIFNGTAGEPEMLNYFNRSIEPILDAIVDEFKRKFLTKTARAQRQSIRYFREPFKLAPVKDLAEIADKFTRNEILTSNEFRAVVGYQPSKDPKADELRNSNMPQSTPSDPPLSNKGISTQIGNKGIIKPMGNISIIKPKGG